MARDSRGTRLCRGQLLFGLTNGGRMKKLLRKTAVLLALLCLLAPLFSLFSAFAEPSESPSPSPAPSAESPSLSPSQTEEDPDPTPDPFSSVLLYHNESGTVLYEKKEGQGVVPAGPAPRMMAALLFLEHYGQDLQKTVTVNRLVTGLATSTMNPGLKGGEQISVYDLLCAMLIANSDDAVYALAFDLYENDSSAPALLLDAINERAQKMGMADTVFFNITGNDPGSADQSSNYSTLDDLLTLALAFQQEQRLLEICAIDEIYLKPTNKSGERRLLTRNYLLSALRIGGYTYPYATGLASASGSFTGHHAIVTARIGSKTFTCISVGAMGLPDEGDAEGKRDYFAAFTDARALFRWGNSHFAYKKVLDENKILGEIKVSLSDDSDYVTVVPEKSLTAFLPLEAEVERDITLIPVLEFTKLTAPVYEGLIVGRVTVLYGDRELGSVRLITAGSLSMSNSMFYIATLRKVMQTPLFLSLMAGIALFLIAGVLIGARIQYLRLNRPDDLEYVEDDGSGQESSRPMGEGSMAAALKELTVQTVKRGRLALLQRINDKNDKDKDKKDGEAAAPAAKEGRALTPAAREERAGVPSAAPIGEGEAEGASAAKSPQSPKAQPQKPAVKVSGAKRMPGEDPRDTARRKAREEAAREKRQGGYVPSGWGERKDDENK